MDHFKMLYKRGDFVESTKQLTGSPKTSSERWALSLSGIMLNRLPAPLYYPSKKKKYDNIHF